MMTENCNHAGVICCPFLDQESPGKIPGSHRKCLVSMDDAASRDEFNNNNNISNWHRTLWKGKA